MSAPHLIFLGLLSLLLIGACTSMRTDTNLGDIQDDIMLGQVFTLGDLQYEADSFCITPASADELNTWISLLEEHKDMAIEVRGHTSTAPNGRSLSPGYGKHLSFLRAKAVTNYLTNGGVEDHRITYHGYAEDDPIADNETAEGRRRNQRVEIKIVGL